MDIVFLWNEQVYMAKSGSSAVPVSRHPPPCAGAPYLGAARSFGSWVILMVEVLRRSSGDKAVQTAGKVAFSLSHRLNHSPAWGGTGSTDTGLLCWPGVSVRLNYLGAVRIPALGFATCETNSFVSVKINPSFTVPTSPLLDDMAFGHCNI